MDFDHAPRPYSRREIDRANQIVMAVHDIVSSRAKSSSHAPDEGPCVIELYGRIDDGSAKLASNVVVATRP